ncbi:MAG: lipoxygenase family protein [Polyangiaceae bacterium]
MLPMLPSKDSDPTRQEKLFQLQLRYRYVYDWPPGVATAVKLYDGDEYGLEYTAKSLPIYASIAENTAGHASDALFSKNPLKAIRQIFDELKPEEFRSRFFDLSGDVSKGITTRRPDSWRDYENIFQTWEKPPIVAFFSGPAVELDKAFAWQRLAGANPMVLCRVNRIPDHFPVTPAIYAQVMGGGDSLEAAFSEGRVYLADYEALAGVISGKTSGEQKYVSAPLALFAVEKGTGVFRPVAIQCGQTPGKAFPVFTPADGWHWRMAMATVQAADAAVHEGVFHLGRTHLVMEAVLLAARRQLAENHPLSVLLTPHFDHTLAINDSAKFSLTAPDGTVDHCFGPRIDQFGGLVRKALQTLSWENLDPNLELRSREVDDSALPVYPYRDDVLPVWAAIKSWVSDYVGHYYDSAQDVQGDEELKAFAREISAEDGGRIPGVPVPNTVDELVEFVTRIVFVASAQHSAVNFSQFPFMGMVVNMPGASYSPPPTKDTPNDEATYTAMMPPMKHACEGVNMVYLLSSLRISTLGHYPLTQFVDPRVLASLARFRSALSEVESATEERDENRLISYPYLRPSQILQSISI